MRKTVLAMATLMSVLAISVLSAGGARATELVMVESIYCEWCERWDEEVGVIYHKTTEGKRAPLRRMEMDAPELAELKLTSRPRFTPTFILIQNKREVGRIEGYPGEDFFWGLFQQLLKKLPESEAEAG